MTSLTTLALRPATRADVRGLERLAALDSQRLTAGPHLLAEADGQLVAAIDESSCRVIADPFAATSDAVALLRRRLEQRTGRLGARPGLVFLRPGIRTS